MNVNPRFFILCLLFVGGASGILLVFSKGNSAARASAQAADDQLSFDKREEAYRANNIGVARLEQFNYKDSVADFRRALEIDPQLKIARINLAIALFNTQD